MWMSPAVKTRSNHYDRTADGPESHTAVRFDGFKCGVGVYPHETGVGLFH